MLVKWPNTKVVSFLSPQSLVSVHATISASEKDLPVLLILTSDQKWTLTIFFHISFYFRKESASKFRVIKKWH